MAKNPKQTSKPVASEAGKVLRKKNANPDVKTFAGSALAQAPLNGSASKLKAR
jgi:hypothetical protein